MDKEKMMVEMIVGLKSLSPAGKEKAFDFIEKKLGESKLATALREYFKRKECC